MVSFRLAPVPWVFRLTTNRARYGPNYPIDIAQDCTRLTLDTIALCGMGYRFNSFYRNNDLHPFVTSMNRFLKDADLQSNLPDFINSWNLSQRKRINADVASMRQVCEEIVEQRKVSPSDSDDLLNALLYKTDPKTGEKLPQSSIIDNMITFLVAGHETTSSLLSFTFYHLLKDPRAMAKVQQEVDQVIGPEEITMQHLSQLPYLNAVLRETLRLIPTAPAFTLSSSKDEVIGGKYLVKAEEPILALLGAIHVDKTVYGPDAKEWKPERMLEENFKKLPASAWKPFGSGKRGCIGRAFAWQESLLVSVLSAFNDIQADMPTQVIASLFQTFEISPVDPSYNLKIKEQLTIKPEGFMVYAKLRRGNSSDPILSTVPMTKHENVGSQKQPVGSMPQSDGKPMTILYGSNTGTCEALAHRLASDALRRGYNAETVDTLDSARDKFPRDHPVILITGSYDGTPPDNAKEFVDWVKSLSGSPFENARYAVFACGRFSNRVISSRTLTGIQDTMTGRKLCTRSL
jgi:cytochrome P450 / NADPH-cytochrome P450 reductase